MTHRRTPPFLVLTLAAALAACGDERVSPPAADTTVAGAPIVGAPIGGLPIGGAPAAPAAPPSQPTPAPTASEEAPAAAPAAAPTAGQPEAPPSGPTTAPATGPASPPPQTPTAPLVTPAAAALGDTASPDPATPGEDPILAAQLRAAADAAATSAHPAAAPVAVAASKKVIEEKPPAKDTKAPAKSDAKEETPELIGFDILGAFEYVAPNPDVPGSFQKSVDSIPADVKNLEGRKVTVEGYMIPLEYAPDDDGVKSFLLSRYQMGCCIGVVPRANELVEVTMDGPKWAPYVSWMPVRATGVLHVGPKEGDMAALSGIYRMHEPVVTVPEPEEIELESDHAR